MQNVPLDLLSPYGNREHATDLTRRATGLPAIAAHSLVLTLDASSTAILRTAGLTAADARPVLAALWRHPERLTDTDPARTTVYGHPYDGRARARYLTDLGQRVHVLRSARRIPVSRFTVHTGLTASGIHDLEAGTVCPTLPLLLTLADTLHVPVTLLVDPDATPLRVLRLIAGEHAAA